MTELGKLEEVELREIWNSEARDFTKWLSNEENLILLGEEIGVELSPIETEEKVGDFYADIHAEEQNTGRKVIIENQLEETNHKHLGQLITYASGIGAEIIIWIVKEVREEHRQAIDWLNEHSDGIIKFFVVRMELWKIGNSLPAPKFQIVCKPNEWAQEVKESVEDLVLNKAKKIQFEFWGKFKEYAESHKTHLRLRTPKPQHWYNVAIGSSKAHMSFTVDTREEIISCEIYIPHSKNIFRGLEDRKEEIEEELGASPEWMKLEGKKASRIRLSSHINITQKETWEEAFEWLKVWGEKFQSVFGDHITVVDGIIEEMEPL